MAFNTNVLEINLNGTGTEIPTLAVTAPYDSYLIQGSATAIGNYAIVPTGSPQLGTTFLFTYKGTLDITTNTTTFSLFGTSVTQLQLLKTWRGECYYNGSAWEVEIHMDFSESGIISSANLGTGIITNANIADNSLDLGVKGLNLSLTNAKIAANTINGSQKLVALSVTDAQINDVNGSKIAGSTVTNAKLATMADQTVKGNVSGGVANPSDISISTLLNVNTWGLTGNSGTVAGTNFLGTTDAIDLVFKCNNIEFGRLNIGDNNVSLGNSALINNSAGIGVDNTAIGYVSLSNNTQGTLNTAIGSNSLFSNLIGNSNTAIGTGSLSANTNGSQNVAIGENALNTNTVGDNNTCIGHDADVTSNSGVYRIALGSAASATADYQFAISSNVTHLNFALNSHVKGATLISDGTGIGTWATTSISTTAGDSATLNTVAGRFRKDTSGSTFTLTNSYITANSIIVVTNTTAGITTGNQLSVVAGVGSAVITFETDGVAAAPSANMDVNFWVIN